MAGRVLPPAALGGVLSLAAARLEASIGLSWNCRTRLQPWGLAAVGRHRRRRHRRRCSLARLDLLPQKEIRDIERDKASGVTIEIQGNSLQKLIGRLNGAKHGRCC